MLLRSAQRHSRDEQCYEKRIRDFVRDVFHHQLNLAITSMVRIEPALVTRPKDDEPSVVESPEKLGVFERFCTSQRISR